MALILLHPDVIYVPPGCPHSVKNACATLALSCNFLEGKHIEGAISALMENSVLDSRSGELAHILKQQQQLCRGKEANTTTLPQKHLPWNEFKRRSSPNLCRPTKKINIGSECHSITSTHSS